MQIVEFNINDYMRVKVTEHGFAVMDAQTTELNRRIGTMCLPSRSGRIRVEQAEGDGRSRWQAWDLMQTFGPAIGLGLQAPFETTIQIELRGETPQETTQ